MKIADIRDMNDAAILEEIDAAEKELMRLRMGNAIGAVESPIQIRKARRGVARLKTVLSERNLKIRAGE